MQMEVINYGEKGLSEMTVKKTIKDTNGYHSVTELLVDDKSLSIKELFSTFRKLGLPLNPSEYNSVQNLVPENVYRSIENAPKFSENKIFFELKDGKTIGMSTLMNVLGSKFQNEMMGYLDSGQNEKYKELFKEADRCITQENRTLGDVIKYATESVPTTRAGLLALNKQVDSFRIYTRSNNKDVLGVTFDSGRNEVMIPLEKSSLPNEQRRNIIDLKSRENPLKRALTKSLK